MVKIVVIVGSESHTTSAASARLEVAVAKDGKAEWIYTPKAWETLWETLESHTTSAASARLEVAVDKDGKTEWQYTPRAWEKLWETLDDSGHKNWKRLELDVPDGTRLRYSCHGRTGARGINKHTFVQTYTAHADAEVYETAPDIGLYDGFIKGRLVAGVMPAAPAINTETGF